MRRKREVIYDFLLEAEAEDEEKDVPVVAEGLFSEEARKLILMCLLRKGFCLVGGSGSVDAARLDALKLLQVGWALSVLFANHAS